jgi:hypothetical protein
MLVLSNTTLLISNPIRTLKVSTLKLIKCGAINARFLNNCKFDISQYTNIMSTSKQPVINAVLITYIDYSFPENYIGTMASFTIHTSGTYPQISASHSLTCLVAQLQFLREWKLSDRRIYEVFERRILI